MKRLNLNGVLAIGLISTFLLAVGCDRVATGELQAGQSTVADLKLKLCEPASVNRVGD